MLRTILAAVLAVSVTQAQVQSAQSSSDAFNAHFKAENTRPVLVDPEFNYLRRGSEEGVSVKAKIDPMSPTPIDGYWGAPSPQNGRLVPTEMEIESAPGFATRSVRYERPKKVSLAAGEPDLVLGPSSTQLHFKLRADPNLAIGNYVIKGKLRFQRVSKDAISEPQELDFEVPVRVAEHNAKVSKNQFYPLEMNTGDWVRFVLLFPIMLPIVLLTWDGC